MTKLCLHCGGKLGIFRRDGFCSSEHRELHHEQESMIAFRRVQGIEIDAQAATAQTVSSD